LSFVYAPLRSRAPRRCAALLQDKTEAGPSQGPEDRAHKNDSLAVSNWISPSKSTKLACNALQHTADMSIFDILGAIATIIQFVEYGVSFSNKAIAVYNNCGELTDLRQSIRESQQQNDDFRTSLDILAPNPTSPEALLLKIAEECQPIADGLLDILDRLTLEGTEKSKLTAIKITWRIERRKKDILAKQQQLEGLRQRCHEPLRVIIKWVCKLVEWSEHLYWLVGGFSDNRYALARMIDRMERDQKSRDSKAARQLTQFRRDTSYMLVTTSSESVELTKSLLVAQRLANINLPQESMISSLVYSGMANRQGMIMSAEHCTYDWIFETTSTAPEPVNFMP
jgi:hypothetical protein